MNEPKPRKTVKESPASPSQEAHEEINQFDNLGMHFQSMDRFAALESRTSVVEERTKHLASKQDVEKAKTWTLWAIGSAVVSLLTLLVGFLRWIVPPIMESVSRSGSG